MFDDFVTRMQSDELAALIEYEEQMKLWEKEMTEDFDID